MVNPNEQRTRQTSRKPDKLSKLCTAKTLLCDQIAACVLIEPSLEAQFDREIDKERVDQSLRSVLALASISLSPLSLAKRVLSVHGPRYVFRLISLVDPLDHRCNLAIVGLFGHYVAQLRSLVDSEEAIERMSLQLIAAKSQASERLSSINGRF